MRLAPFADNRISEGTVSHRIHGMNTDVAALGSHVFTFVIPYTMAKLTGVEVVCNVCDTSDMTVRAPDGQGGFISQQYGFSVNIGEVVYTKESGYAAEVLAGYEIDITVNNLFNETRKLGVNFILHEVTLDE